MIEMVNKMLVGVIALIVIVAAVYFAYNGFSGLGGVSKNQSSTSIATSSVSTTIKQTTMAELTPQKVGETWWNSIFTGDWNTVFASTVNKSNNSLSSNCQNTIKAAYASFVGATYSLKMENTTTPCTSVHSPLPIPSSECIAVSYSLVTNTKFGNSTGPMFLIKIGNDWKVQIDCKWYSGWG